MQCGAWNQKELRKQLPKLRVLCKAKNPAYFLPRIRRMCAEVGVAVVFVRGPARLRGKRSHPVHCPRQGADDSEFSIPIR